MKARRGTVIFETENGILLNAIHGDKFLLPGGSAAFAESFICAACREFNEETGLVPHLAFHLFDYSSPRNEHKIYLVKAFGQPKPMSEIEKIGYWKNGEIASITDRKGKKYQNLNAEQASATTKAIITLYEQYKAKNSELFKSLSSIDDIANTFSQKTVFVQGDTLS